MRSRWMPGLGDDVVDRGARPDAGLDVARAHGAVHLDLQPCGAGAFAPHCGVDHLVQGQGERTVSRVAQDQRRAVVGEPDESAGRSPCLLPVVPRPRRRCPCGVATTHPHHRRSLAGAERRTRPGVGAGPSPRRLSWGGGTDPALTGGSAATTIAPQRQPQWGRWSRTRDGRACSRSSVVPLRRPPRPSWPRASASPAPSWAPRSPRSSPRSAPRCTAERSIAAPRPMTMLAHRTRLPAGVDPAAVVPDDAVLPTRPRRVRPTRRPPRRRSSTRADGADLRFSWKHVALVAGRRLRHRARGRSRVTRSSSASRSRPLWGGGIDSGTSIGVWSGPAAPTPAPTDSRRARAHHPRRGRWRPRRPTVPTAVPTPTPTVTVTVTVPPTSPAPAPTRRRLTP